jgi:hypothetical protein
MTMLWVQFRAKNTRTETRRSVKTSNTKKISDLLITSKLLEVREAKIDTFSLSRAVKKSIFEAPLLITRIVARYCADLVTQYSLLGRLEVINGSTDHQTFLNTDVSFSAAIRVNRGTAGAIPRLSSLGMQS